MSPGTEPDAGKNVSLLVLKENRMNHAVRQNQPISWEMAAFLNMPELEDESLPARVLGSFTPAGGNVDSDERK